MSITLSSICALLPIRNATAVTGALVLALLASVNARGEFVRLKVNQQTAHATAEPGWDGKTNDDLYYAIAGTLGKTLTAHCWPLGVAHDRRHCASFGDGKH